MLVVLPVGPHDRDQAERWIKWAEELGGFREHELLVACARRVSSPEELVRNRYGLYIPNDEDERGWPQSPNHLFKRVIQHITWTKEGEAFLWCEPDCIPLVDDWLDRLTTEYNSCGKPFMGARVLVDNTPEHMTGNAIYGKNAMYKAPYLVQAENAAFDVVAAEQIIGQAHWTDLIQHVWKKDDGRNFKFPDQDSVKKMVRENAVLFHQNKDGSLINRLREKILFLKHKANVKTEETKTKFDGITVVYKTYGKDLIWLRYSLLSLTKFFNEKYKLLIYCHDQSCGELEKLLGELNVTARVIPVMYDIHGYLKQMVVKCMAWKDVDTEFIMFIDSDVIFKSQVNFSNFFKEDKIKWFYLNKSKDNEKEEVWNVWGDSILRMLKHPMSVYYMYNSFPFVIRRDTLKKAYLKFIDLHDIDYLEFCRKGLDEHNIRVSDILPGEGGKFRTMAKIFEEFEYLGWYCHNHTKEYAFLEGPNFDSMESRVQFWSHGGISQVEGEIKQILNLNT